MVTILVVSPHLDDAVFSAGQFLAARPGAVVVTVLAGAPIQPVQTKWDLNSGFTDSQHAITIRRDEDRTALAMLGAIPVHLDYLDCQYKPENHRALVAGLTNEIEKRQPELVVGPLGLGHADHIRVRDAVLAAHREVPLWLYGDLPYRVRNPRSVKAALKSIRRRGYATEELRRVGLGVEELKTAALACYPSQLQLIEVGQLIVRERFWRATRSGY